MFVLTSITTLAVMTARKAMIFIARMPFRIIYPAPESVLGERVILLAFFSDFACLSFANSSSMRSASKGR